MTVEERHRCVIQLLGKLKVLNIIEEYVVLLTSTVQAYLVRLKARGYSATKKGSQEL